jgi:hypothetical protein
MTNQRSGEEAAPPGLDFVFEAGKQKIDEQLRYIDSLDVKMGVLIAFLGAIIAGLGIALLASDAAKLRTLLAWHVVTLASVVLVVLAADLYFAFQAFRVRQYYFGVRFQDLVPWTNENLHEIKKAFLPTLIRTVDLNERQLKVKQHNALRAVQFVFVTLLALLLTVISILARIATMTGG